jgi:hypothetical protein
MAKASKTAQKKRASKSVIAQSYKRINDQTDPYYGFLDVTTLVEHGAERITIEKLKEIVNAAIDYANKKSSRELLAIPEELTEAQLNVFYKKKGKELFKYFVRYCGDPASTAYDCINQSYAQVAKDNFRNNLIQKGRMNSGWRYQHLAKDAAQLSNRFDSVSDLNLKEADFNAVISHKEGNHKLSIYVSIKNRSNTMGGQDWPKAIHALEGAAINDKNRNGSYICVFGIAMEKGVRYIKTSRESKQPLSFNTEVWLSDFFWPFFTNFSYDEIAKAVLDVLITENKQSSLEIEIPEQVIESFGDECNRLGIIDGTGRFNDAHKLVDLFTGNL